MRISEIYISAKDRESILKPIEDFIRQNYRGVFSNLHDAQKHCEMKKQHSEPGTKFVPIRVTIAEEPSLEDYKKPTQKAEDEATAAATPV